MEIKLLTCIPRQNCLQLMKSHHFKLNARKTKIEQTVVNCRDAAGSRLTSLFSLFSISCAYSELRKQWEKDR